MATTTSTTTTETVAVDREAVIEAIAELYAAARATQDGPTETPMSKHFDEAAAGLQVAAFGSTSDLSDDEYDRDPTLVEINARQLECLADVYELIDGSPRAQESRESATRTREAGRVSFWLPGRGEAA